VNFIAPYAIISSRISCSRLVLLNGMSGSFMRSVGSKGTAVGQFNFPRSVKAITVGTDRLLIVADTGMCRAQAAKVVMLLI
jgi:hypothetical protein